jgi:uncharacterized protein CbrC (UPF0167 family)
VIHHSITPPDHFPLLRKPSATSSFSASFLCTCSKCEQRQEYGY